MIQRGKQEDQICDKLLVILVLSHSEFS